MEMNILNKKPSFEIHSVIRVEFVGEYKKLSIDENALQSTRRNRKIVKVNPISNCTTAKKIQCQLTEYTLKKLLKVIRVVRPY